MRDLDVQCSQLKELRLESYKKATETYAAIDRFTNELNAKLKTEEINHAFVAVTSHNIETGNVVHQTLEVTPASNDFDGRSVEITTIDATSVQGQGMAMYHYLAENSGLWAEEFFDQVQEVPDRHFVEVGIGNINKHICMEKVSNK